MSITASDVVRIYVELEAAGIVVWLDGGWAADALLGEQTRRHKDLDILVSSDGREAVLRYLEQRGFAIHDISPDECALVATDCEGRQIDVKLIEIGVDGSAWHGAPQRTWFSSTSLEGKGRVLDLVVRCVT